MMISQTDVITENLLNATTFSVRPRSHSLQVNNLEFILIAIERIFRSCLFLFHRAPVHDDCQSIFNFLLINKVHR